MNPWESADPRQTHVGQVKTGASPNRILKMTQRRSLGLFSPAVRNTLPMFGGQSFPASCLLTPFVTRFLIRRFGIGLPIGKCRADFVVR